MVDLMDAEEIRFVIGHELGHVLSGHSVYRTMLYHLINLAARLALVPFAWIGLKAVIWGLEEWYRKSELSCDRAGLLATQDVEAARRALMKTAGGSRLSELSHDAFHEQAQRVRRGPGRAGEPAQAAAAAGHDAPVRRGALRRAGPVGRRRRVRATSWRATTRAARTTRSTSVGDEFRSAAKSYQDSWSRSADPLIGAVRGVAESAVGAAERLFNRFGGGGSSGA